MIGTVPAISRMQDVRTTQKTRLALSLDPKHILSVSFPAMSDYTQIRPVGNVPVWPNTTTMLGDLPMKLFKALTGIAPRPLALAPLK